MCADDQKLRILLKDCANGFYQQMYFLGKDVIHARGNQLQACGFCKSPSVGLKGTSCYTLESKFGVIQLYGSCAGCYNKSSRIVFLRKQSRFYRWLPEHRLVAGQWSQRCICLDDPDVMLESVMPLLMWWVTYEKWIEERFGTAYREQCFSDWSKIKGRAAWLAPVSAINWVKQFVEQGVNHVRPKHFI